MNDRSQLVRARQSARFGASVAASDEPLGDVPSVPSILLLAPAASGAVAYAITGSLTKATVAAFGGFFFGFIGGFAFGLIGLIAGCGFAVYSSLHFEPKWAPWW